MCAVTASDALPHAYHSSVWISSTTARQGHSLAIDTRTHVSRVHAHITRREDRAQIELYRPGATCTCTCMRQRVACGALPARMDAIAAGASPGGYSVATVLPGWAECRVQRAGRHEVNNHKGSYSDHREGEAGKYRCRAQEWIQ